MTGWRRENGRARWEGSGLTVWLEGDGLSMCSDPVRERCRECGVAIADVFVEEWKELYVRIEGADATRVRFGSIEASPRRGEWRFVIRNYLGKSAIRVTLPDGRTIVTDPVEVVSRKTPLESPEDPLFYPRFLRTLLNDLVRVLTTLPFERAAPTAWPTEAAAAMPSPLFVLHVLSQNADVIRTALQTVLQNPHRRLISEDRWVRLHEAAAVDADTVLAMVRYPEHLQRSDIVRVSRHLRGFVPERVFERRVTETLDTPENRFIRHFVDTLLFWCDELQRIGLVSGSDTRDGAKTLANLRDFARFVRTASLFADVGEMGHFPASSQVLLKRDGYRECLQVYRLLHLARVPFFERLQDAVDNRRVDVLYESWCFFRLSEMLAQALGGDKPRFVGEWSTETGGLRYGLRACLPQGYELIYNRTFPSKARVGPREETGPSSYSIPLRPDFSLMRNGRLVVVLDAKFRFDTKGIQPYPEQNTEPSDVWEAFQEIDRPEAVERLVSHVDLYKMHAYRDALGCRVAVALYPGTQHVFYRTDKTELRSFSLKDLVLESFEGIGAIPLVPGRSF